MTEHSADTTTATAESTEVYLGFTILENPGGFEALPRGWEGPSLRAETLDFIRKRVWCWWYRLA